jgi:hypothetical protein
MMKKILFLITILSFLNIKAQIDSTLRPYLNFKAVIETDVIYDINQMDPDWIGGLRPSKIPVYTTDPGWGSDGHLYYSLRSTTFKFDGGIPVKHNWDLLKLYFEFDLWGMGVHAGETSIRFKLAYGDWGNFRVGKDWSTFVDLGSIPNTYEWWGPPGMALLPTATLRYTGYLNDNNKLEAALEIPGADIDPGQLRQIDPSLLNVKSKEQIPDIIGRYTKTWKTGYLKIAAMYRLLEYDIISIQNSKIYTKAKNGWAVNLTSNIKFFTGKFKLQTVFGQGYAGYNNDGGVEIAPDEKFNAVVPFQYGFAAFYDYKVSEKITGTFGYSETVYDNSEGQTNDAFHKSRYALLQLNYELLKPYIHIGANYQFGQKFNKDGNSAYDQRIMVSFVYSFNTKIK